MTGRSVDLWSSTNPDAAIPARVKLRVFERCGGKCALTGKKLMPGDAYDFDHIIPLALGGAHAEDNLQVVWREAHRKKTAADIGVIRKADRIRTKHLGLKPRSPAWGNKSRKLNGTVVEKAR